MSPDFAPAFGLENQTAAGCESMQEGDFSTDEASDSLALCPDGRRPGIVAECRGENIALALQASMGVGSYSRAPSRRPLPTDMCSAGTRRQVDTTIGLRRAETAKSNPCALVSIEPRSISRAHAGLDVAAKRNNGADLATCPGAGRASSVERSEVVEYTPHRRLRDRPGREWPAAHEAASPTDRR